MVTDKGGENVTEPHENIYPLFKYNSQRIKKFLKYQQKIGASSQNSSAQHLTPIEIDIFI